ncbi:MAG TPA: histidine kinase [Acidimicrobiales bacterium]|nr:histidine kinase [Acidimicrobiales bacterium]
MNEPELRASRARMEAATHAARRRIERTLHDGPQQHLVALAVKLRLAESEIDEDPERAKATLAELRGEVQDTIQHLRDLAYQIYPPLLADRGLGEALRAAAGRAAVEVDLTVAGDGSRRYDPELEAAVYFSVLEAIEAAEDALSVSVGEEAGNLVFEVRGPLRDGPALLNVADRTDTCSGTLVHDDDHLRGSIPI